MSVSHSVTSLLLPNEQTSRKLCRAAGRAQRVRPAGTRSVAPQGRRRRAKRFFAKRFFAGGESEQFFAGGESEYKLEQQISIETVDLHEMDTLIPDNTATFNKSRPAGGKCDNKLL